MLRVLPNDTNIRGYAIPAGTMVTWYSKVIGQDPGLLRSLGILETELNHEERLLFSFQSGFQDPQNSYRSVGSLKKTGFIRLRSETSVMDQECVLANDSQSLKSNSLSLISSK